MHSIQTLVRNISIAPFQAYLPHPFVVNQLLSPLYDVISTSEARSLAKDNEKSFLHCTKPEIDLPPTVNEYSDQVYQKGKTNLHRFLENQWLSPEFSESIYIYCMNHKSHSQFGVLCTSSCKDYEAGLIKVHEMTREAKVKDRMSLISAQNANSEAVMLMYRHRDVIDELVHNNCKSRPIIDYVSEDGVQHLLWACSNSLTTRLVEEFAKVPASYIADGHHRSEASVRLAKLRREIQGSCSGIQGAEYFLTVIVPDNQLKVMEYNRVIKRLPNGMEIKEVLEKIQEYFYVFEGSKAKPQGKGYFTMFVENRWVGLTLKRANKESRDIRDTIDSFLLTKYCLEPVFGISDITKNDNIEFVGGIRGTQEIEKRCRSDCTLGFVLHPVEVEDVMKVSDSNSIMPPKSTWFEPKPRSGIALRILKN